MLPPTPRGTLAADVVAGLSVGLVLVPQAMAYADLAGMPPVNGLYAAATAPLLAAPFVSSRYLQTGPVALTALLTFGALSTLAAPNSAEYIAMAALLALLVGAVRLGIGVARLGAVAWLMSQPVLRGFTLAAALLIGASQIPAAVGVSTSSDTVLGRMLEAFGAIGQWNWGAVTLAGVTIALMRYGKRIHPLFPGVLVAAALGLGVSVAGLPVGPSVGDIPGQLPPFSLDLPWGSAGALVVPALVIALVGFAEPAAIARTYASEDREQWNPNREFVSQGVANLAAGLFAGFPMGGSFSRSGLSKVAGARSWRAGAFTGAFVLLVLPFANLLAPLPRAVLGATVLGAVISLLDPTPVLEMWRRSKPQAALAAVTFGSTLLAAPRVERGVLVGVAVSIALHLWREMQMDVPDTVEGTTLTLRPLGVLWFGTAARLEQEWNEALAEHPDIDTLVIELGALGRIDFSGAEVLATLVQEARAEGMTVRVNGCPPQSVRILARFELVEKRDE